MFYDRYFSECAKKGISPSKVLDELNISRGNLGRWKAGGEPRNEMKKALADFLGIDVELLMYDKKEKPALLAENEHENDEVYKIIQKLNSYQRGLLTAYAQGLLAPPKVDTGEK